ncbi:putative histone-lysine N-methyltransferase set-9 [Cercophora samala]|uniref:Histone-lysine N-methyltransferase SET9 n=1 Tax=Cercophora samala TaxID=330535 RepID=A0AA40DAN1_9PEZI|nr:putative histone-lysine N-methyltransferase set-9 [Cercophora samala]
MPPRTTAPGKKKLTLAQLAAYDDILTDALIDRTYYWTTIPKNRTSYHPSRGVREEEIAKLIQTHLIINSDLKTAEEKLLATDGLRRFYNGLKTPKEKDDFKAHMRRYMSTYLPECPFEVNATNRYTIVTYEASITARRFIRRNETIKYLAGIQVTITPEEEADMASRKKDFSLVVSSRSKSTSLFMGPARFANHDCDANARLVTCGQAGIEIIACRDIGVGEEITVSYSESYFGEDNCECLCQTCEARQVNGWQQEEGGASVKRSIEDDLAASQGYSFRRRLRDESVAGSGSRTPSVTPDIRPRVLKKRGSQMVLGDRQSSIDSTDLGREGSGRARKRAAAALGTPPITPAKRLKTMDFDLAPTTSGSPISRGSSESELLRSPLSSEAGSANMTDITTPASDSADGLILSPEPTPIKQAIELLKNEQSTAEIDVQQLPEAISPVPQRSYDLPAILPTTEVTPPAEDLTKATPPVEEVVPVPPSSNTAAPTTPAAKAKASKKGQAARPAPPTPAQKRRVPGDYTLTPLLLSEPETAWIHCTNCNTAFVQKDAYFTRANCPRCERHSKLYGYVWPKTQPAGKNDKEERILDHRLINRFLDPEDEARARGKKSWREGSQRESTMDTEGGSKLPQRGRARIRESLVPKVEVATNADLDGVRRSGRARRASAKVIGVDA